MKTFLFLIFLSVSTLSNADCIIQSSKHDDLAKSIKEKGWDFENYDTLCNELKKNKLALDITQISQISPYQTSVMTTVKAYPVDLETKYSIKILSKSSYTSIEYDEERTSAMKNKLLYENANYNLNELSKTGKLEIMVKEINQIRERLK